MISLFIPKPYPNLALIGLFAESIVTTHPRQAPATILHARYRQPARAGLDHQGLAAGKPTRSDYLIVSRLGVSEGGGL